MEESSNNQDQTFNLAVGTMLRDHLEKILKNPLDY